MGEGLKCADVIAASKVNAGSSTALSFVCLAHETQALANSPHLPVAGFERRHHSRLAVHVAVNDEKIVADALLIVCSRSLWSMWQRASKDIVHIKKPGDACGVKSCRAGAQLRHNLEGLQRDHLPLATIPNLEDNSIALRCLFYARYAIEPEVRYGERKG